MSAKLFSWATIGEAKTISGENRSEHQNAEFDHVRENLHLCSQSLQLAAMKFRDVIDESPDNDQLGVGQLRRRAESVECVQHRVHLCLQASLGQTFLMHQEKSLRLHRLKLSN